LYEEIEQYVLAIFVSQTYKKSTRRKFKETLQPILESVYFNTNGLNGENDIDAENLKHVSSLMISSPRIEDQPEGPLLFL
jgi:hypothetical protein